jgi:hypothetical protein
MASASATNITADAIAPVKHVYASLKVCDLPFQFSGFAGPTFGCEARRERPAA